MNLNLPHSKARAAALQPAQVRVPGQKIIEPKFISYCLQKFLQNTKVDLPIIVINMELNKIANKIFNKCAIVGGACSAIVAAAGGGAALGLHQSASCMQVILSVI